jgi:hypothetical protein
MRDELERVRKWADDKLTTGDEPPWAWYQYMKLREAVDAILTGMDSTSPMASLQQAEPRQETHLRLVGSTYPQDTAQPHPSAPLVPLPM